MKNRKIVQVALDLMMEKIETGERNERMHPGMIAVYIAFVRALDNRGWPLMATIKPEEIMELSGITHSKSVKEYAHRLAKMGMLDMKFGRQRFWGEFLVDGEKTLKTLWQHSQNMGNFWKFDSKFENFEGKTIRLRLNHFKAIKTQNTKNLKRRKIMKIEMISYSGLGAILEATAASRGSKPSWELVKKVVAMGHYSVLEHITMSFLIRNISRALLQELARHRFLSLTVESTRYTLKKKLKKGHHWTQNMAMLGPQNALENVYETLKVYAKGGMIENDELKYLIPEAWLVGKLVVTTNARELFHVLELRLSREALMEFNDLSKKILGILPDPVFDLFEIYLENEQR